MEAVAAAVASVLTALIGLVGVRLEGARKKIETTRKTNESEHKSNTLLLETVVRAIGGLREDVRHLTKRFNDHVDKDHP